MSKKKPHFIIEPFKFYRRGDLYIKCGFDADGSESSINPQAIDLTTFSYIVDEFNPNRTAWPCKGTEARQSYMEDGSSYWSLVSDGGWFELDLLESYNPHCIMEVIYDFANPGIGQLDLWVNGVQTEVKKGPASWSTSLPHLAIDYLKIRGRQRNFGLSDPPARGELDNLRVYKYNEVNCEMSVCSPAKATGAPKVIETLRGKPGFQTTQYLGAQFDLNLRFSSAKEHTDFIYNCDTVHLLCDDKGMFYRGVVELGEVTRYGKDLYEQEVVFRSANRIGEGWK